MQNNRRQANLLPPHTHTHMHASSEQMTSNNVLAHIQSERARLPIAFVVAYVHFR